MVFGAGNSTIANNFFLGLDSQGPIPKTSLTKWKHISTANKNLAFFRFYLTADQGNEDSENEIDYKSTKVFINPACFAVYVLTAPNTYLNIQSFKRHQAIILHQSNQRFIQFLILLCKWVIFDMLQ